MFYVSIDGDRIGETLEKYILEENIEAVQLFSRKVSLAVNTIKGWLEKENCEIIFAAGDGVLATSSKDMNWAKMPLEYEGISFSVGVSTSPRESLLALKIAKGLGRNQIIRR